MTALRSRLVRNNTLVRLALLALFAYTLLPAHLVWCSEDNSVPQMELAVNGQCLAGINNACCTGNSAVDTALTQGNEPLAALTTDLEHDHCTDCVDVLIHVEHASLHAAVLLDVQYGIAGGCLFSLASSELPGTSLASKPIWQTTAQLLPTLTTLHTQTTRLLI